VRGEDGRWRIWERTGIYEKDRMDPVQPSLHFWLIYRFARFSRFPAEYRHLAFGVKRQGLKLAERVVMAHSREEVALKAEAATWLAAPAVPARAGEGRDRIPGR